MKTAFELAMERLNQQSPSVKLTAEQKQRLADLDSRYKAKLAEMEINLNDQIAAAAAAGDAEKHQQLETDLRNQRRKLQSELEEKKDAVRRGEG